MDEWTVDCDGIATTVAAEPGAPVKLMMSAALSEAIIGEDGKVTVTTALSVEKAEQVRRFLGVAIGNAQGTPQ